MLLCLLLLAQSSRTDKIVFVHGILATDTNVEDWTRYARHLGYDTLAPKIGNGVYDSVFMKPENQCNALADEINNWTCVEDRIALIGFSQGGLLARCVVEEGMLHAKISKLITVASPNRGIYYMGCPFCTVPRFGVDPHNPHTTHNVFISQLNNEGAYYLPHRKANIEKLSSLGAIVATLDTVVVPPQSAVYSYYNNDTPPRIVPLLSSAWYNSNVIGLKSLFRRNALHMTSVNCTHTTIASKPCMDKPVNGRETSLVEWVFDIVAS